MPDIQTALKTALATSGMVPSQLQRIWTYVKDHPGKTAKRIQTEVKVQKNSVSSLLSQMVKRKMLEWKLERHLGKPVRVFYASAAMDEFELLPEPKMPKAPSNSVKVHKTQSVGMSDVNASTAQLSAASSLQGAMFPGIEGAMSPIMKGSIIPWDRKERSVQKAVDAMTVAEAREMYGILNKLFGTGA